MHNNQSNANITYSMASTSVAPVIPNAIELPLPHFQQRHEWDCGLSCILMILPKRKQKIFLEDFGRICADGGFNQSTWTIDLCFILRDFNVAFRFLTKTLGVDPSFKNHSYYSSLIPRESVRVNAKFKEAFREGMPIEQRMISFEALVRNVAFHGPVILLTNSALLNCTICSSSQMMRGMSFYTGHYIVVCGYDSHDRVVKFRDPAKENHLCVTSYELMDKARTAHGTDEDVILIYT